MDEKATLPDRNITENYVPPSMPAEHARGVLYQGEFETPSDGTALAVRRHARALADQGVPVLLRSFSNIVVNAHGMPESVHLVGLPPEVETEVGDLTTTSIASLSPVIKHIVIRSAEHLRQLLMPRSAVARAGASIEEKLALRDGIYRNTIVYSVWERDRIDPAVAEHLARVRQCWVPCTQNARLLVDSGVPAARVHVVPHPYLPDDVIHKCRKRKATQFEGWKRFYSIGRWEPRKGFDQLIRAFLMAFRPNDKASLTIKYSGSGAWKGYGSVESALTDAIDSCSGNGWTTDNIGDRVRLIGERISRKEIVRLHFDHNIYVSSSHGEAWNLGAFDAKLAGSRMVYVPWGGVCDFASDEDIAIPCTMIEAHKSYGWEHGAKWAGYTDGDLAEGLRRVPPPVSFDLPGKFEGRFGMDAVGQKMRILVDVALRSSSLPPE